jgi:hypothetical protein
MTVLAEGVADGAAPEILDEIWSPGCAAAIWRRTLDQSFQEWIDALSPDKLPEARIVALRADRVEEVIGAVCKSHGIAEDPCGKMLAADIAALAALFARVMDTEMVRLRLDAVSDDACTKFHLDQVPARMLCTYRGRGTEYGRARAGEVPRSIYELATGSVGLFRQQLWPSSELSGIAHRSPSISELGETRLLLAIDPVDD